FWQELRWGSGVSLFRLTVGGGGGSAPEKRRPSPFRRRAGGRALSGVGTGGRGCGTLSSRQTGNGFPHRRTMPGGRRGAMTLPKRLQKRLEGAMTVAEAGALGGAPSIGSRNPQARAAGQQKLADSYERVIDALLEVIVGDHDDHLSRAQAIK